jgi:hypothetical protein
MAFFSDLARHLEVLRDAFGGEVEVEKLPSVLEGLDDESVVAMLAAATELVRAGEKVRIAASGVAAARSTRDAGHDGLAQKRGHRSPTSLIQEITGATRAEAAKHVRLGEALRTGAGLDAFDPMMDAAAPAEATADASTPSGVEPWHAPLGLALLAGTIGSAQHDAILRGLGDPPPQAGVGVGDLGVDPELDGVASEFAARAREAWMVAAEQLIVEARVRTVEELARAARTIRDQLDPEGAQHRFDQRFEGRAFRLWRDADGIRHGSLVFEDFGGAWAQSILDAALRPRRGGPRFADSDEKAHADELAADPRTNDQLAYDLILDVLRAGTLADTATVFGTRQPGVRVLITQAALDTAARGTAAVGLVEDDQTALPAWLIAQRVCDTGTAPVVHDQHGNPLDLGREARLYSPKQRLALAIRDGGCRWRGCDRPASYCEAHHLDEWARDSGRTDIDRGILLCRWHHMELHHGGWRITREGKGDFILHPPPGRGDPVNLPPRLALRYAWGDIDPPPRRFQPAA